MYTEERVTSDNVGLKLRVSIEETQKILNLVSQERGYA